MSKELVLAQDGHYYKLRYDNHCLDGPATVYSYGGVFWYIHGILMNYEDWLVHPEVVAHRIETERMIKLEMI